jgi:ATP adenylyltransferase
LTDLTDHEHLHCMQIIGRLTGILRDLLQAHGFNVGLNLGAVAGAGVPDHLHWHLVARWPGDTNFMPVVSRTHVISQSLGSLWELLAESLSHS